MARFHPVSARLVLLALLVSGCGFQLRGTTSVPPALAPIDLQCQEADKSLCDSVRTLLALNDVPLADSSEEGYRLVLRGSDSSQRATALTSTASAAEYDLTVSVEMMLLTPDGIPLRAAGRLSTSQTYRYDENSVLAKNRERRELADTLNEQLAQQVLYALSPYTRGRIDQIRRDYEATQAAKASEDTREDGEADASQ